MATYFLSDDDDFVRGTEDADDTTGTTGSSLTDTAPATIATPTASVLVPYVVLT